MIVNSNSKSFVNVIVKGMFTVYIEIKSPRQILTSDTNCRVGRIRILLREEPTGDLGFTHVPQYLQKANSFHLQKICHTSKTISMAVPLSLTTFLTLLHAADENSTFSTPIT